MTLNDADLKKVTQRIIELGDKKQKVTTHDLPYIISDVLDSSTEQQRGNKSYVLTHSKGLQPSTTVAVEMDGETLEENASGDGQYDAFLNAIRKIYKKKKNNCRSSSIMRCIFLPEAILMRCVKQALLG